MIQRPEHVFAMLEKWVLIVLKLAQGENLVKVV